MLDDGFASLSQTSSDAIDPAVIAIPIFLLLSPDELPGTGDSQGQQSSFSDFLLPSASSEEPPGGSLKNLKSF